ncbi:PREDICTED: probable inactive receptor kinase At5g10020 [Tarenaya hassleriana]|uniref:probable inactive receptor kinase At5g10020 n=1 Tax=Tarenaya hassleriana TaxID=28532 RepID=UPI00053C14B8|nr:PREDICTED: probable inactive receptor kinase At5g10020 [Tarenaya hassleriana]
MSLFVSLVTSLCFLSVLLGGAGAVTESELRSLLEFRKGIRDDSSNPPISWPVTNGLSDPKTCPDAWPGISCDPEIGSIVAINLDRRGLSGELKFSTLLGLTSLRNLSLSGNNFSGRVVPALGAISSLQHLDLSDNSFYGPIPSRITDLWGLNYLNLSANRFQGGFPSGLRNLQQLRFLDLHGNELWGDVGEIFTESKNVEFVDLSCNRFHGGLSLPLDNISSISNTLHHLNLSHNTLNGGFFTPDSIGLFKNLELLDLENNQINGKLPPFGSLPSLKLLKLGRNQLFGSIPEELLQGLIPLRELDLSRNGFTGSILEINSTTLSVLNLSLNGLSGDLPSALKRCLVIDLSGNMFSGDISVIQKWEATPEFLDLSSNNLSGSLPDFVSAFSRLSVLNIRNNSLDGALPSLWDNSGLSQLSVVDLSSNQFSGSIPASFFSFGALRSLNLSLNNLTGQIPLRNSHASELLALPFYSQMELLDLSTNSLMGVLPGDISAMERLAVLKLANNKLSGELPSDLNKLTGLKDLDLSNNSFKGHLPDKLPPGMAGFNVSYNDLSGMVPENLRHFPHSSFYPGNSKLNLPGGTTSPGSTPEQLSFRGRHHTKSSIRIAIIVASVGTALMILFVLFAYHRTQLKEFQGRSGFTDQPPGRDVKVGRSSRPSFLNFNSNVQHPSSSLSFSNDHLLTSNSRSLSGQTEFAAEISEQGLPVGNTATSATTNPNLLDDYPAVSGRRSSPGGSPLSSPRFSEQPVMLDVYSPDRLAGELFFLDASLKFTAEELSRAPAEVLGRSSHGTLYKATLDNGYMLTVKWLRIGLVKHKKDFAKEAKKFGSLRHPNIVPLRAYYWGPREQERLLLSDYTRGDSLALHLYETTPRRYSPLSFSQRLKVAVDVASCLLYLHDRSMPHGNLKPTNIILTSSPDYTVRLTDYCLHRLMTPAGIAEQILNMGALGYCAPELVSAAKPNPTLKADVYTFGVILMELLTRRSAGDIISGQSGAVDLPDWVRLCDQEGRRMDCIDRDIAVGEEISKAMEDMLAVSLRCIGPVNERPNIRQVLDDLSSISV